MLIIIISFTIKMKQNQEEQVEVKAAEKGVRQRQPTVKQLLHNGGNQLAQKYRRFTKMEHQDLLRETLSLIIENRRLKNRINDHQPFKQKAIRPPNQEKVDKLIQQTPNKKYAMKVCYLGWNYDGMSCQAENDNSVEEYIFKVMHTTSLISRVYPPDPSFTRAGRTDKGVSAMGNVISLNLRAGVSQDKPLQYCRMMNAILPEDIRIIGCEEVSPDFNARYWCKSRRYKYYFARGSLDIELLKRTVKLFEGTHNFINYCKINVTNTVNFERTLFSADVIKASTEERMEQGDDRNQIYYFYYVGKSFLWHQIRYMSSILFMIGLGKESPERLKELLSGSDTTCKPNYPMAPDYPLILEDCGYEGLSFSNTDPQVTYSFYNTFYKMMHKMSIQKVMITNCMIKARQELTLSGRITNEVFKHKVVEMSKKGQFFGCRKINISSGQTLEETISGLKGMKKQLYMKKAEKQAAYEEKIRIEKLEESERQDKNSEQLSDPLSKKIKLNQDQKKPLN